MARCLRCKAGNEWIEGEVKPEVRSNDLLFAAIEQHSIDMHQASLRPCDTCRKMTAALGKPYGCYAFQKRVAKEALEKIQGK